jgi:hypothetical protein
MSSTANNSSKPPALIKAAGLWAKSSVKGGQYLTGRMGGLKVLILENRDRKSDDDPSHHLFVTEAPDRRQGAAERPQERGQAYGHGQRVPDHQAPLQRGDGPAPARDVLDDAPEWAR